MEVGRINVQYGFEGSLEERVERLQEIAQRHEGRLDDLAEIIGSESEQRRAEIESLRETLGASERKLEERIREAAANGLTTATVGVAFSFSGVALSTLGGSIA
jgi:peptidoglycan hydrolase CwlO-like protein